MDSDGDTADDPEEIGLEASPEAAYVNDSQMLCDGENGQYENNKDVGSSTNTVSQTQDETQSPGNPVNADVDMEASQVFVFSKYRNRHHYFCVLINERPTLYCTIFQVQIYESSQGLHPPVANTQEFEVNFKK